MRGGNNQEKRDIKKKKEECVCVRVRERERVNERERRRERGLTSQEKKVNLFRYKQKIFARLDKI